MGYVILLGIFGGGYLMKYYYGKAKRSTGTKLDVAGTIIGTILMAAAVAALYA